MHEVSTCRTENLERIALGVYRRIAEAWALTDEEQCQILAVPALPMTDGQEGWVDQSVLLRVGIIISIYRYLHTIFSDRAQADVWIDRANIDPLFFWGGAAIRLLCGGSLAQLMAIRDHLEA